MFMVFLYDSSQVSEEYHQVFQDLLLPQVYKPIKQNFLIQRFKSISFTRVIVPLKTSINVLSIQRLGS